MKTKEEFLKSRTSYPELAKKLLNKSGLTLDEMMELDRDLLNIDNHPGFTSYDALIRIAKRNHFDMLECYQTYTKIAFSCTILRGEGIYSKKLVDACWQIIGGELLNYLTEQ